MNASKLLVITLIFTHMSGCATTQPQKPHYFASNSVNPNAVIEQVALVKVLAQPEIETVDLGYTREQGAAAGAAFGALSGYNAWASGGECEGYICGAYVLLLPVFLATGAVVGGIEGAYTGYSSDTLKEAEENAHAKLNSAYLQTQLIDHARTYATNNIDIQFIRVPSADPEFISEELNYAQLSGEGFDIVFELSLTNLSFGEAGLGIDRPYLKMEARARLISVNTGKVLIDKRYKFLTKGLPLKDWASNGAAMLAAAIENGLQKLAEDIVEENFLLFYPIPPIVESPDQSNTKAAKPQETQSEPVIPHYVLKPIYPAIEYCFFCEGPFSERRNRTIGNLKFVDVNNIQPTLQWERFPRALDHIGADGQYHQFSDVRYDIRIFEANLPNRLVYTERNIIEPYHKVKESLSLCTDYLWTVRARFKLSGQERATEWAGAFPAQAPPWILRRPLDEGERRITAFFPFPYNRPEPEWYYYPFRIPCE